MEYGKVYKVVLLPPKELKGAVDSYILVDNLGRLETWFSNYFGAVGYMTLYSDVHTDLCMVEWPEGLGGDGDCWCYPVKAFKVLGEVDLSAVDGLELARHIIF